MVARERSRRWLNAIYLCLESDGQRRFYEATGSAFHGAEYPIDDGVWTARFARQQLSFPLTSSRIWLDWESALAALGHETFLKETYRALLQSPCPPDVFVDIGANYGNHSLLFLVHEVDVLTFEPNNTCHAYFREVCALNRVNPRLEPVALGAARGEADLVYPRRETWLGSVDHDTINALRERSDMVTERVQVKRLDDYLEVLIGRRVLIKIDAEGHEVSILQGAHRTLHEVRPLVLFESWNGHAEKRAALLGTFRELHYCIAHVPLVAGRTATILNDDAFLSSTRSDFIAFAVERARGSFEISADTLFS
jgi:FkbM family methyltransferase